jgi:hypothetical protein
LLNDFIQTAKLPDEFDLKLYDIVVYEHEDAMIIHRIINIEEPNEDHPDHRHFTLRGDSAKYSDEIPEFVCRYKVKGGLTGYAQVYGKYNTSAYNKLKMDLIYIQNYSLAMDFKLILMTVRILFKKDSTEGFDDKRKKVNK